MASGTAMLASARMGHDMPLSAARRPVAMNSSFPVCPLGFRRLRRERIHQRRIQSIVGLQPLAAQRVAHVSHQRRRRAALDDRRHECRLRAVLAGKSIRTRRVAPARASVSICPFALRVRAQEPATIPRLSARLSWFVGNWGEYMTDTGGENTRRFRDSGIIEPGERGWPEERRRRRG